jgi:hypothetical protein
MPAPITADELALQLRERLARLDAERASIHRALQALQPPPERRKPRPKAGAQGRAKSGASAN